VVSGGLDEVVKVCDLESGRGHWAFTIVKIKHVKTKSFSETVMGQHTDGVRCIEFCATMRVAVSGGWDNLLKVFFVKSPK
jgi:hypothetical protein